MDISKFYKTSDLLPILNAAIITDLFVIYLLLSKRIQTNTLKTWYKKFRFGAFIADVLSIVIGIIIARFIYSFFKWKWSIGLFLVVVVIVQLIHDLSFYKYFSYVKKGYSEVLDVFSAYAKENRANILIADASMMISTVLLSSCLLSYLSFNWNVIILIILVYMVPYFLYSV
jgi:hypothetical protein